MSSNQDNHKDYFEDFAKRVEDFESPVPPGSWNKLNHSVHNELDKTQQPSMRKVTLRGGALKGSSLLIAISITTVILVAVVLGVYKQQDDNNNDVALEDMLSKSDNLFKHIDIVERDYGNVSEKKHHEQSYQRNKVRVPITRSSEALGQVKFVKLQPSIIYKTNNEEYEYHEMDSKDGTSKERSIEAQNVQFASQTINCIANREVISQKMENDETTKKKRDQNNRVVDNQVTPVDDNYDKNKKRSRWSIGSSIGYNGGDYQIGFEDRIINQLDSMVITSTQDSTLIGTDGIKIDTTYITRLDTLFQNGLVRYGNSFSIVFFARYAITPYLWSEFGIGYGFRQVTIKGEGINADGYQHFIEVPIKMGFNSINWKGWQALGYVGLEFRQEIAKSTLLKKRKLDEQQLNGYLGLGANYSINKSSSLELNLSLGYNFLRISEQSNNFLYHIELRYIYTIP